MALACNFLIEFLSIVFGFPEHWMLKDYVLL